MGRSFSVGDRVVIQPPKSFCDFKKWNGRTGVVEVPAPGMECYVNLKLDDPPFGLYGNMVCVTIKDWLRHLEPLTPLEEQIAAYVKAEKA